MIDKSQYRLLPANRLDEFEGYDRVVAQNHISNCGCIIVSPEYGDPIDDEYMLEEIYSQIDGLKESVIKRGKVVKLTENDLKYIVLESINRITENNYKNRYTKMIAAKHAAGKSKDEIRQELSDYFAKIAAMSDMNKDRSIKTMDPHEQEFNNQITSSTFDIDFRDLYNDDIY